MKVTKKAIQLFLKDQLANNKSWTLRALERIHSENQTAQEQSCQTVVEDNGIGFTGCDGHILSSFADQYARRKSLSDKQMGILFKKMPKYWRQVLAFIGDEQIANIILSKHEK